MSRLGGRLEFEAVAIDRETSDGLARLVRKHDRPALFCCLLEEGGLHFHGRQREIVERRHPTRMRAPRSHAQVTEKAERPVLATYDDRLMATGMTARPHDVNAR